MPRDELVDEAVKLGEQIGTMSKLAVSMAKEAVNACESLPFRQNTTCKRELIASVACGLEPKDYKSQVTK